MADIKGLLVPFDKDGNMCHGPWGAVEHVGYSKFHGRFVFDKIHKYSSNVATFKDGMDRIFYMNQSEFERIIPFMVRGVLEGEFYFSKQGKYFSLKYLEDAVI
jgi:hypothetical protein